MKKYEKVPYPRPDYTDPDLISAEMANGTFAKAVLDDVSHFRPVLDRYNVTEDKLVERSVESGAIKPEDYDLSMRDVTLAGVNETAWQPYYVELEDPEPEIIYNPIDFYTMVEWHGRNSTELPGIASDDTTGYHLSTICYDDEKPGLFGFKEIKDEDGNIIERYAAYYSLITETLSILGRLPDGYDIQDATYIGYVRGAYILNFAGGRYVSFLFDGSVLQADGYSDRFAPLGEYGCFAVTDGSSTYILNTRFERQLFAPPLDDPGAVPTDSIPGDFCAAAMGLSSGPTKYPFGIRVGRSLYVAKDNNSSYRYRNTKRGWMVATVNTPVWKYGKMLKYDYATDNWFHSPLKLLHYNMIAHGIFTRPTVPPHNSVGEVSFPNSDRYGDFAKVGDTVWHTYDFKKWEKVTGDGADQLYGCSGRVWTKGRSDGIVGLMPYAIEIVDAIDPKGGRKTVLVFEGFIFRGGA
ncbi:hypothetical protein [Nitratifractor salsuginis]|uniref:Uncharacterized protein n=1 Tax=Nitratifractor salsuginis (strain DSM 16511 / JCM 12458 / E9I37-1) TaxID=749222 RepID=E6WY39_NITSE|nr:hypothetical protein [Nitratifractor salsuginis]ADV46413.1 hypothetical protein Nitsa_1160 [Nitratifractor salsuginis DSM 16511]